MTRRATQTWAVNAELFVTRAGMNPCPEAYANRGATTADLNGRILSSVHEQIRTHIGSDAASHFICMVNDLPFLSAEAFLTMVYTLEVAGWNWERNLLLQHGELSSKPSRGQSAVSGASLRDETRYIRSQFLDVIGSKSTSVRIDEFAW